LPEDFLHPDDRHVAVDGVIDHDYRGQGAASQAGNPFEVEPAVLRCFIRGDPDLGLQCAQQEITALNMAGRAEADFDGIPAWSTAMRLLLSPGAYLLITDAMEPAMVEK
jgi:hypothetical protein